jgi:hypothetical protein
MLGGAYAKSMSTVQDIKDAISKLSATDRASLSAWLAEADANEWDHELENDAQAGRLKWLADEARDDLRSGRCRT